MAANIETSFQAAIDAGKIGGAVICATDAEGHFVYNKTIGERTLLSGEKQPHKLDDVLFLASATKLITTIAALQCVEDGLLSLTADVSSVAPELAAKQVIASSADDGTLQPRTGVITLKTLLTHTSGTAYEFIEPKVGKWRAEYGVPRHEHDRLPVEGIFDYPLVFQPDSSWMYGPGLDWAGRIVERLTGRTLGEYSQQRIFDPLGINSAEFYPVTREDLRARLVDLNPDDPDGQGIAVLGGSGDIQKHNNGDFGGHGLFMAGIDYVKILRSLLANDGKILKPETVETMFQHHLNPEATKGHQIALASPAGVFFRVGVDPETKMGHGLGGLITLEDVDGWYGTHTLTWGGGLTFTWFIDRKNDICGLGAVQSKQPVDGDFVGELKQVFRRDVYRKKAAWKEKQQ